MNIFDFIPNFAIFSIDWSELILFCWANLSEIYKCIPNYIRIDSENVYWLLVIFNYEQELKLTNFSNKVPHLSYRNIHFRSMKEVNW